MTKMLPNVDYLEHNYQFEGKHFLAKVSHQQFDQGGVCNVISFATCVQKMSFVGGVQTIISTLKLWLPPKSARATTRTQL
jgi:hypothetical protein